MVLSHRGGTRPISTGATRLTVGKHGGRKPPLQEPRRRRTVRSVTNDGQTRHRFYFFRRLGRPLRFSRANRAAKTLYKDGPWSNNIPLRKHYRSGVCPRRLTRPFKRPTLQEKCITGAISNALKRLRADPRTPKKRTVR